MNVLVNWLLMVFGCFVVMSILSLSIYGLGRLMECVPIDYKHKELVLSTLALLSVIILGLIIVLSLMELTLLMPLILALSIIVLIVFFIDVMIQFIKKLI